MTDLLKAMNWRYATKQFDPNKKLSSEQLHDLLEAVRLSPSSYGLQPWKMLIITNKEIRAKLKEAGFNQPQIAEASHLVVFAARTDVNDRLVDEFIENNMKTRSQSKESLQGLEKMIKGFIATLNEEQRVQWAARQAYIALGVLITAAAATGIDAGPMEGFNANQFDEILGLKEQNLRTQVIAALGFRIPTEPLATMPKVRWPESEIFIKVD